VSRAYIEAMKAGEDFMLQRSYGYASEAEYTRYIGTKEKGWPITGSEVSRER
jgi:hypothetical protein